MRALARAFRSRQNLKYGQLSKFTRDAAARVRAAVAAAPPLANIDNWQGTRRESKHGE